MKSDAISYVITIRTEGAAAEGENKSGVAPTNDGSTFDKEFKKNAVKTASMAVATIKTLADTAVTTYINRVDIRTGNSALAEKLSFQYSTAKQLVGIGSAAVYGVIASNPYAIAGASLAAMYKLIGYNIEAENIRLRKNLENISITQANIRAGAGGDRSGRNPY